MARSSLTWKGRMDDRIRSAVAESHLGHIYLSIYTSPVEKFCFAKARVSSKTFEAPGCECSGRSTCKVVDNDVLVVLSPAFKTGDR